MATKSSGTVSAPTDREDRRRSARRPYVVEAWLASPTAKSPDDRVEVWAVNVNRHGLAFELPHSIPTDAYYLIHLGIGPQMLTSEVRIISCRKAKDGVYQVGAEFC